MTFRKQQLRRVCWLACAAACCASAAAQSFSFQPSATYAAQGDPLATAAADFNGDGKLDLAVANSGVSTISVFPGKGDGSFLAPVIVSIPNGCFNDNVVAGDFNNDGNIDLLTVCALQTTVWVVPGLGNGQFGAPVSSTLPQPAMHLLGEIVDFHTIAVADFNRDGKLDLVLATDSTIPRSGAGGEQLNLLLGNGDGTFQKASTIPTGEVFVFNVAAADFDGDGNPDLVVDELNSAQADSIAILKGDGTGSFTSVSSYTPPGTTSIGSIRVADVNRDGIPDIIATSTAGSGLDNLTSYLTVLTGNGDFTFNALPSQIDSQQVFWTLPVDLHGSGTADLVEEYMNFSENTRSLALDTISLWIRQGNGDGTFQSPQHVTLPSGLAPWWFEAAAGDFNGDGAFDLAFTASPASAQLGGGGSSGSGLNVVIEGYQKLPPGDLVVMLNALPPPPPVLAVSQRKIQLTTSSDGANASQTVAISNLGAGTLNWTANSSASWLTVTPGSGAGSGSIKITAEPGAMQPNAYKATITVSAVPGGTRTISVSFTVTAPANTPTISSVENGASFLPGFEAGSWVTIKGSHLSNTDPGRTWLASEIVNGNLPTFLDHTSVTIDGRPAYVYYISPTQLNVQAPDDSATGSVQVVVTNNSQVSNSFTAQLQAASPAFFLYTSTSYAIATRYPDNALIGDATVVPGTIAAKPGDVLILWGTGFGPTTPATPAGIEVVTASAVATLPTVTVGGIPATVIGAALSPGSAGLYQVAIQLPSNVPTGAVALQASVSGSQSPAGFLIYVGSP